ncbi:hypothetical protein LTR78_003439 [Recurvomyces mirabilis]|uniref:Non-homologous end-joining factor 1 n=1 Tax=Recurvomyces mirabilis TaxID=574656 RepID=A0AAE0WRG0_9PEZI|nr:hypothetical protein LTR78_003439 [Recurvomyces mirabilis]KAK5154527.1 hypothetical protein LTS14_006664 [Recurvomyces mirabilis]
MASWKSIRLPQDNLPHLLVKARLDPTGYTIHLTDLSRIWSETLTKREVERRAIKEDCSIDPGEDDQQYSILLDKLRSTLTQQDNTTLTLKPAQQADGLLLDLSAPLPHPLQPLKWTIHLTLQPQPQIATQLIHPLILLSQTQHSQTHHLIHHELSEKDRIIAKLTDRLETSGNDLTTVFPGVSHVKLSRRKTQREQLARYVRGLGDFDEGLWRQQVKDAHREDGAGSVGLEAMEGVLSELPEAVTEGEAEYAQEWWKTLDESRISQKSNSHPAGTTNGPAKQGSARPTPAPPADTDHEIPTTNDDSFDADFQRQGTPPHLRQSNHRPSPAITNPTSLKSPLPAPPPVAVQPDDESTEDESDLDAPIKKARPGQASHSSMPTRRRSVNPDVPLAESSASERQKHSSPPPVSPPQQAPQPRGKLGAIGGKLNAPATPSPPPEAEQELESMEVDPGPAPGKPRTKLGTIGGRSKTSTTPPPGEPVTISTTASPAKRHGLGTIGGKKAGKLTTASATDTNQPRQVSERPSAAASASATTATERKSRAPERNEIARKPTLPRETSQERADRKRNELKRQLDEKAKVPVKKKRKF